MTAQKQETIMVAKHLLSNQVEQEKYDLTVLPIDKWAYFFFWATMSSLFFGAVLSSLV